MDTLTPHERSKRMALVRSKDTRLELRICNALQDMGYRFKRNQAELPGKPDIIFSARRKAIFLHGCFWHGHLCRLGRMPKTRRGYWQQKIEGNRLRDMRVRRALRRSGWSVLVVWECQARNLEHSLGRIVKFVSGNKPLPRRVARKRNAA
jgi:DNA mismatch endonuclease (patch repair protein)